MTEQHDPPSRDGFPLRVLSIFAVLSVVLCLLAYYTDLGAWVFPIAFLGVFVIALVRHGINPEHEWRYMQFPRQGIKRRRATKRRERREQRERNEESKD
jgi:hypothetical protein